MDEPVNSETFASPMYRDPVVAILFGVALLLIVVNVSFAIVAVHTRHIEVLKIPMFATGTFAIVGIVLGLMRSLRSAAKRRIA